MVELDMLDGTGKGTKNALSEGIVGIFRLKKRFK
jgi:hypothetical protein